ncbi:MAG TPA: type III secretion system chaperone [Ramlibacter sp.]|nr:type III secretion system chaperone [Ramlibacter sp.]
MHFEEIIRQLATHLRLPALAPETDGTCAIQFDAIAVALVPHPERGGFAARAQIGNIARPDYAQSMEALLGANLFDRDIGNSVLGMDAGGDVYLTQHFKYGPLTMEGFLAALRRFVNRAEQWQQRLIVNVQSQGALPQEV